MNIWVMISLNKVTYFGDARMLVFLLFNLYIFIKVKLEYNIILDSSAQHSYLTLIYLMM